MAHHAPQTDVRFSGHPGHHHAHRTIPSFTPGGGLTPPSSSGLSGTGGLDLRPLGPGSKNFSKQPSGPTPPPVGGQPPSVISTYDLATIMALIALMEAELGFLFAKGQNENALNSIQIGAAMNTFMQTQYQNLLNQIQQQEAAQQKQNNIGWGIFAGSLALDIVMIVVGVITMQPELIVMVVVMAVLTTTIPGHQSIVQMMASSISSDLQKDGLSPQAANVIADVIVIVIVLAIICVTGGMAAPEAAGEEAPAAGAEVGAEAGTAATEAGTAATEAGSEQMAETLGDTILDDTTQPIAQRAVSALKKLASAFMRIFGGTTGRVMFVTGSVAMSTNLATYLATAILDACGQQNNKKALEIVTYLIMAIEAVCTLIGGFGMMGGAAGTTEDIGTAGKTADEAASTAQKIIKAVKSFLNKIRNLMADFLKSVTKSLSTAAKTAMLRAAMIMEVLVNLVEGSLGIYAGLITMQMAKYKKDGMKANAEIKLAEEVLQQCLELSKELNGVLAQLLKNLESETGKMLPNFFDQQKGVAQITNKYFA